MLILPSDDVDDSRVVEDVYVPFEIISVVDNTLVDPSTPTLDEVYISFEDTSDVDAMVESSTHI